MPPPPPSLSVSPTASPTLSLPHSLSLCPPPPLSLCLSVCLYPSLLIAVPLSLSRCLGVSQEWVGALFEPVRRTFFVAPVCGEKDYAFYMSAEAAQAEATVAMLIGVHPKAPGQVYKEVVLFKHHRCVHVYKVCLVGPWSGFC